MDVIKFDYNTTGLLKEPHKNSQPPTDIGSTVLVKGSYMYFHYGCDGFGDVGWGCGYRTLQTLCSWIRDAKIELDPPHVPSIVQIQSILVAMEDKPAQFLQSHDWIGSFEVCLVIDQLYGVPCKIMHSSSGGQLSQNIPTLVNHFAQFGSPIMMGGDKDCSSKAILGVHTSTSSTYLLVLDPHFVGQATSSKLQGGGWIKWQPLEEFIESSFYNICLPQLAHPSISCATS